MGKCDTYFISNTPPNPVHPETRQRVSRFAWVQYPFCVVDEEQGRAPGANTLGYSHFGYSEDPIWNQDAPMLDEIACVTPKGKIYQVTASLMEHMAYMMKQYEDTL